MFPGWSMNKTANCRSLIDGFVGVTISADESLESKQYDASLRVEECQGRSSINVRGALLPSARIIQLLAVGHGME